MRQADERQLTEQPLRVETAQLYRDGLLYQFSQPQRSAAAASLVLCLTRMFFGQARNGELFFAVPRSSRSVIKRRLSDYRSPSLWIDLSRCSDLRSTEAANIEHYGHPDRVYR
jgi:hypothetical protein